MSFPPITLGSVLALVVLVLSIVLIAVGRLPVLEGGLIGVLALARLS